MKLIYGGGDDASTLKTHWNREKMAAILQTIFSNASSRMKIFTWISIRISLRLVPKGQINNILTLIYIMAWCPPGDNPLSRAINTNTNTKSVLPLFHRETSGYEEVHQQRYIYIYIYQHYKQNKTLSENTKQRYRIIKYTVEQKWQWNDFVHTVAYATDHGFNNPFERHRTRRGRNCSEQILPHWLWACQQQQWHRRVLCVNLVETKMEKQAMSEQHTQHTEWNYIIWFTPLR